ncbi:hypothetical protein GobsT_08070 [Gemmata obscuriglobus]|nr:hypothetical protein [Gemmata obscuriglobus]QEG26072.1 hypothetical protein GobsT_08070 [Gemmata obscuriglobus]VTS00499.1 Uncharacterized protein OS=Sorangium cellulosum (strain So ce56) GN=sce5710 PE=4 SV=1 [Gemmata obscuriglobus UQM 2246]
MTEAEWLAATDPTPMLEFLRGTASARQLRLFGCAAVRAVWSQLAEELPNAVAVAEEYADGTVSKAALRRARHILRDKRDELEAAGLNESPRWNIYWLAETVATINAYDSVVAELDRLGSDSPQLVAPDWPVLSDRFRDVFGNPFRSIAVAREWLTSDVRALAEGIYAERAFDGLPILADALQEAGCDSEDLLNHLRGEGPHVRGCWALDLVLGKS